MDEIVIFDENCNPNKICNIIRVQNIQQAGSIISGFQVNKFSGAKEMFAVYTDDHMYSKLYTYDETNKILPDLLSAGYISYADYNGSIIEGKGVFVLRKLLKEHLIEKSQEEYEGVAYTLIVTKLDRMARSISKGTDLIEELIEKGITVNILNLGVLDNTPASKLVRNIFLAFSEFERDMIVERTTEGRNIARLKDNYVEGRPPKYKRAQLEHALGLLNSYSYAQVSDMTGISVSTLTRARRKFLKNGGACR